MMPMKTTTDTKEGTIEREGAGVGVGRLPSPGVYDGWSMDHYQMIPAASSHRLHELKRSPLHCWHYQTTPHKRTGPLLLGSLVNAMLLEPETVPDSFCIAEQCFATTKLGKRCTRGGSIRDGGEWFCKQHAKGSEGDASPDEIVTQEQFGLAGSCVLAIKAHPAARSLLDDRTDTEVSLIWEDDEAGLLCKARPDFLIRPSVLGDLKTCRDASRRAFERAIFDYGYGTQAAFYRMGLKASGLDIADAALICVETEAPHAVAVYQFQDDVMDRCEREVRRLLRKYAECLESGDWHGHSRDVELIGLPGWVGREDESL